MRDTRIMVDTTVKSTMTETVILQCWHRVFTVMMYSTVLLNIHCIDPVPILIWAQIFGCEYICTVNRPLEVSYLVKPADFSHCWSIYRTEPLDTLKVSISFETRMRSASNNCCVWSPWPARDMGNCFRRPLVVSKLHHMYNRGTELILTFKYFVVCW